MKSLMRVPLLPRRRPAPSRQGCRTGSCRLEASALDLSWQRTCDCTSYLSHHHLTPKATTLPAFRRFSPRSLLARRPRKDETGQKGQSALICGQVHAS